MSDKATIAALLMLMSMWVAACGREVLVPTEKIHGPPGGVTVQNENPPPEDNICDDLEVLYSTCPALPYACPDEETAQCILDHAAAFPGYCEAQNGGERCEGGTVTQTWIDYCTIRACFGHDYDACIAEGEAACEPSVCDLIEAEAGHCAGYGYDCPAHPVEQSWCFLNVLLEYDDSCFLFDQTEILCALGQPTCEGDASCKIQECFELTTYQACYGNLELLCEWVP